MTGALLAVVALVSFRIGQADSVVVTDGGQAPLDLGMMWKVKSKLEETFLEKDKIQKNKMEYGAIEGMVESLGDPYTVFLPPKENKSANDDLAGEFSGVGIQLGYKDKTLAVQTPLPQTPAEKAGLRAGDLILRIVDKEKGIDKDTSGITLDEAVELIRGKRGTKVVLKLFREGEKEAFEVELVRDNIVVPSIEMEWVERSGKKVAWVKLYKFTERLFKEWPQTVDKILKEKGNNYGGIVLDLRNNPGGFLQASVLVASDFLDKGVVVKQETAKGISEVYEVDQSRRKLLGDKLVVLVNGGSASAAEILAGALKSYGRGKLVGEKTFGKGTVQQPEDFADGSGLHVTVARWLLPDGKNIHKEGVTPEVEVKYEPPKESTGSAKIQEKEDNKVDNQLEKAIEELWK